MTGSAESPEPAGQIMALDHVQLAMPAGLEDVALGFYEGLLGLAEVTKPLTLAGRGGCWFERGRQEFTSASTRPSRPRARPIQPSLSTIFPGLL